MNRLNGTWELIQGGDGRKHVNMHCNSAQPPTPILPEDERGKVQGRK